LRLDAESVAMTTTTQPSFAELAARARALIVPGQRRLLGITGPPGAGKSTLAMAICTAMGDLAVYVPMDGFHLPNEHLDSVGLRDRKGAPETFDAAGFVGLLGRLRDASEPVVLAPAFARHLDAVISDAIAIPSSVPLVVTEGNYLLLDAAPWRDIRRVLDETWYLRSDETRVDRLIRRHIESGKRPKEARAFVLASDEANARVIGQTEARADLVIIGLPALALPTAAFLPGL
jgi:pantothenate kinase